MHRCPEAASSEALLHGLGVSQDEQRHAGFHLHSLLPPLHCQEERYAADGVSRDHVTRFVTQAFAGSRVLTAHAYVCHCINSSVVNDM